MYKDTFCYSILQKLIENIIGSHYAFCISPFSLIHTKGVSKDNVDSI
jgi:hypothetical protein